MYRVHALPESMRPLVWDFGQLNPDIEELYTRQIVSRFVSLHYLPLFYASRGVAKKPTCNFRVNVFGLRVCFKVFAHVRYDFSLKYKIVS